MRILKRIVEMIFIFVLPILLLLCTFKKAYVYDSNNNLVSQRIEFNSNIFSISEGDITYTYYEYYDYNEEVFIPANDTVLVNYNISPVIRYISGGEYIYLLVNDTTIQYSYPAITSVQVSSMEIVESNDYSVVLMRQFSDNTLVNKYGNIIKDFKTLTIRDNIVNRGLNIIFGYFGISDNVVLQLLVVYVLLMLIMLLIWYVIYVPFDMLFGLLLRKLEYYR